MKKIIKYVIAIFFSVRILTTGITAYAEEETPYYINYYGVELTEEQYNNMLTVYDADTVYYMTPSMLNGLKDEELHIYSMEEIDSETIKPPTIFKPYENGIAVASVSDWNAYWETNYKKMYLSIKGSTSLKTVTLRTVWKKLTKSRYYDVMGFRVKNASFTFNTKDSDCLTAWQKADGRIVKNYNMNSSGVKTCRQGIGLSAKLDQNATNSLEFSITVKFASGADPYEVYGTYQHAQKEVSESQSKKYDINSSGYGGVFKFDSSVANKYDKTEGLHVKWSLDDYLTY